jgi:hypothetical protein
VAIRTGTAIGLQAREPVIEEGHEAADDRGAVFTPAAIDGICRAHLCYCLVQRFAGMYQWQGEDGRERNSDASLSG